VKLRFRFANESAKNNEFICMYSHTNNIFGINKNNVFKTHTNHFPLDFLACLIESKMMQGGGYNAPVIVVNSVPKTESARETQIQNIDAAKTVADVIRTCLGPRAMLKMILR
jgi:hypothetical protein